MLKKIIFAGLFAAAFTSTAEPQALPAKVTGFLNHFYTGWRQAPGVCENKKWVLTGDFDGDGKRDYLVRVKTGKTSKVRLNLIAFFGGDGGNYAAKQILDDPFKGDLLRSAFSVIKKGTKIHVGEGKGPVITLRNDAASQYVCQTDAVKTMIYEGGRWRNIYEE